MAGRSQQQGSKSRCCCHASLALLLSAVGIFAWWRTCRQRNARSASALPWVRRFRGMIDVGRSGVGASSWDWFWDSSCAAPSRPAQCLYGVSVYDCDYRVVVLTLSIVSFRNNSACPESRQDRPARHWREDRGGPPPIQSDFLASCLKWRAECPHLLAVQPAEITSGRAWEYI